MNINNEVLINAFKEEMIRSNNSSKWWNDHLSEQITSLFGSSMESSVKDAIYSSAKAFIDSGALATSQYFYATKELNEKKEIFASATLMEKRNIWNQVNKEDKDSLLNNNKHLGIKDIYEILTMSEFPYEGKKEVANLLAVEKIRDLKENYPDLDELLKSWLGEKYNQIFGPATTKNEEHQPLQDASTSTIIENNSKNISTSTVENNTKNNNTLLTNYQNATNKMIFFNSIANMQEKQELFNKLDEKEKRFLINDKNLSFLKSFYHNAQNKEKLLDLMNQNTLQTLYNISGIDDKEFISNHLYQKEQESKDQIQQNLNHIKKETQNIENYHQAIDKSRERISNLKNDKKEIKLKIKNSKVIIKQLEKRKEKLEKKLTNAILKKESRIAFISKKRLEKIKRLSNEMNLMNGRIRNNQDGLRNIEEQLKTVETKMNQEKNNIQENKNNISKATRKVQDYAQKMYNSRVQIKDLSSFHKELVGKKTYNHNKNNKVMTVNKAKTNALSNRQSTTAFDTFKQANHADINRINPNSRKDSDFNHQTQDHLKENSLNEQMVSRPEQKKNVTPDPAMKTSKVAQNQKKLESAFNEMGITYHPEEFVSNTQNASYLPPDKLTSMTYNQAKMMQLYFEAQYAKKMVEIAKMQQEMAMGGRTKTLSKAGFSDILILLLSLAILSLVGAIMLLIFK